MFKHVLIPVDMSHPEKADEMIAAAKKLADENARFVLLNVIHPLPAMAEFSVPTEYTDMARDKSRQALKLIAQENDVDAAVELTVGQPAHEILQFQQDQKVDLIIVGSHRPGFQDYLLGSTAARVVRHAQCPVLIMR